MQSYCVASGDDEIFDSRVIDVVPMIDVASGSSDEIPKWVRDSHRALGQLLVGALASMIADQSGLEYPASEEAPTDIVSYRLGTSPFKVALQGAGNLRMLQGYNGDTSNRLFTIFQGGVGAEWDLAGPAGERNGMRIAIRFSPIYGEVALVRVPERLLEDAPVPAGAFAGSSIGIESSRRYGFAEPGMRAYTRVEWQNLNYLDPALTFYAAVYCRFHLEEQLSDDPKYPVRVVIMPILSYYDRGDARVDMYSWNRAQAYGNLRGITDLKRFWEGQVKFEVRY